MNGVYGRILDIRMWLVNNFTGFKYTWIDSSDEVDLISGLINLRHENYFDHRCVVRELHPQTICATKCATKCATTRHQLYTE